MLPGAIQVSESGKFMRKNQIANWGFLLSAREQANGERCMHNCTCRRIYVMCKNMKVLGKLFSAAAFGPTMGNKPAMFGELFADVHG